MTTSSTPNTTIDLETSLCGSDILRDEEFRFVLDHTEIRTFKKGTHLLRPGQIARLSYQNFQGCVREYHIVDGEERTTEFYTEGQSISSTFSSLQDAPVNHYWECVEDCTLSVITSHMEKEMFRRFPRLERMCRVATEIQLGEMRERMSYLIYSTPQERYLQLLNTRPELLDRVPQYQLASFIGVKPESLSRIRRRISGNY